MDEGMDDRWLMVWRGDVRKWRKDDIKKSRIENDENTKETDEQRMLERQTTEKGIDIFSCFGMQKKKNGRSLMISRISNPRLEVE